jgi:hypothetical protein
MPRGIIAQCARSNIRFNHQMWRKLSLLLAISVFPIATAAAGAPLDLSSSQLLSFAWPDGPAARVDEIGRGVGVVFSPDLSVPDNCHFYQALGFACFQDADWTRVLDEIHRWNVLYPERRISTLVLETHGTNGNGLKLQGSYDPRADRSYISIGALQERLQPEGIYNIVVSACNSGRLLRPYIYNILDPYNGDKLFLPATCGIVNASPDFDGEKSPVMIIRPASSHIETTLVGSFRELSLAARRAIIASANAQHIPVPKQFAVSDIMAQMVTRDSRLRLTSTSYVDDLSREVQPVDRSEELFRRFVTYVNAVAARESVTRGRVARRANTPKTAPDGR